MRWPWQKKPEPKIGRLATLIGELLSPQYADQWSWDGTWLRHQSGDVRMQVHSWTIELLENVEPFTEAEQKWLRPQIEFVIAIAGPRMAALMLARVERLVAEVRAGGRIRV